MMSPISFYGFINTVSKVYRTEESENRFSPLGSKSRENVSLDKLSRYDMILMHLVRCNQGRIMYFSGL